MRDRGTEGQRDRGLNRPSVYLFLPFSFLADHTCLPLTLTLVNSRKPGDFRFAGSLQPSLVFRIFPIDNYHPISIMVAREAIKERGGICFLDSRDLTRQARARR